MSEVRKTVVLLAGLMAAMCVWPVEQSVPAGSQGDTNLRREGNPQTGRSIFNGKGLCYYCHGMDGYLDKLPQLAPDTAAFIAQLDPKPADLRNRKELRLPSDKARARIIREGHLGTGMFPDTTLTDQDIKDTVAYLAALRKQGQTSGAGPAESKPLTGDSIQGEELYKASCVVCHGALARGGIGPRLAGNPVLLNDQAFWKVVHEGRHVMPPLKDAITDRQMADIRSWLKTLP